MPKWWKNLSRLGQFFVGLASVAGVVIAAAAIYLTYWQHENDQEQHQTELRAELVQAGQPYEKDGFTHLLFRNKSPQGKAVVSTVWFVIDDPELLKLIERAYPKPPPPDPDEKPLYGAMISPEEAFFRGGQWDEEGRFVYVCGDSREAEQMEGIVLRLAVFDDKLAGRKLTGVIVLTYNEDQQLESKPLTLVCQRETSERPASKKPPQRRKWFRKFKN